MTHVNYFSADFIEQLMQKQFPANKIKVKNAEPLDVDNSASILAVLTAGRTERLIGHFGLSVSYEMDGKNLQQNMVMKIKPHGNEIVEMLNSLAAACGGNLAETYERFKPLTGFQYTHVKEQEIYEKLPSALTPEIFGLYTDHDNHSYIILMEYLQDVELLNSVMEPEKWTDQYIKQALTEIAEHHAKYLNQEMSVDESFWPDVPSLVYMKNLSPLWLELLENATERFPELYTADRYKLLKNSIDTIPDYWRELQIHPKTFIHNDFNPRNTCFKIINGLPKLCVYDWELATYHLPQYEIVELLCFVLDRDRYHLRKEYLEYYRQELNQHTSLFEDKEEFEKGFYLAARDFGLHRLGLYMMAHSISPYPFLPRVVNSYFDLLESGN